MAPVIEELRVSFGDYEINYKKLKKKNSKLTIAFRSLAALIFMFPLELTTISHSILNIIP